MGFSVHDTRQLIDKVSLPNGLSVTRWNRCVSRKVNIMCSRVLRDRLPTRWNLSLKSLELPSLVFPMCDDHVEKNDHLFLLCNLAGSIWRRVFRWVDLVLPGWDTLQDIFDWLDMLSLSSERKTALESIIQTVIWVMWRFRNDIIFVKWFHLKFFIFDDIVNMSYNWFVHRNNKVKATWVNWLQNPLLAISL
uniref:Reverse transcriptase zinc-binding domain-containing protein n=1 Tax=Lactuca sativa TaxID=4236 RepID=A0A9R1WSJ0_LACSA|nr:hypothetical protein LSAT_V11C100032800 [Lactuca sativa]